MAPYFEPKEMPIVLKCAAETPQELDDVLVHVAAKTSPLADETVPRSVNQSVASSCVPRKRDLLRQVSMRLYLKGKDVADDLLRNVAPFRLADAEHVCGHASSSLEHEIRRSKKTRKHMWMPHTQDDAIVHDSSSPRLHVAETKHAAVDAFFIARITDPTSYFYRFHYDNPRHLAPRKAQVELVNLQWLKPHEQIVSWERVNDLCNATRAWDAYTEPLLVDKQTGAILDGHHRYHVALQLQLTQVPAVLVDYLNDATIQVDVWPGCGRSQLSKDQVIAMALSSDVFPPKTSRHRFSESLPPISIPLSVLRQPPLPMETMRNNQSATREPFLPPPPSRRDHVSIRLICGAPTVATSLTKTLVRSRLRTQMDLSRRPGSDSSMTDFFTTIRQHDPTSSFCRQKTATLDELLTHDAAGRRQHFFLTRLTDPTSYFYKYHVDAPPPRDPKRVSVFVASLQWLQPHEHVVSWDRVDGLRRATLSWNAYLEPLLVDIKTGAILDGHHRYHVALQLHLECVPVVLVDYLADDTITVDVWPNCGRDSLTKDQVIAMALSDELFPPKTSRHAFSDDLPPVSISLDRLRVPIEGNYVPI